jgi:hypothetical protein
LYNVGMRVITGILVGTLSVGFVACEDKNKNNTSDDDSKKKDEGKSSKSSAEPVASALDKAKSAASTATKNIEAAEGGSTCEQAYVQIKELISAFQNMPGNQANPKVPEKTDFMKACTELPPDIQKCMLMSELFKDPAKAQKCKTEIDGLDEATKKKAKALMKSAMAKGT